MTQEDKDLLLKDLSGRLPYGVKVELTWWVMGEGTCINPTLEPDIIEQLINDEEGDTEIKPYLRPMSSMTEEERKEYYETMDKYTHRIYPNSADFSEHTEYSWTTETFDFLNAHHLDYRGLIPMGLAIAVTKENNPYK